MTEQGGIFAAIATSQDFDPVSHWKSLRMSTVKQRQRDETDKLLFYSHLFLNSSSNTWQQFWHWNLLTCFVFCASTVENTQFRELIKCVHACSVVALISTWQSLAPPKIFSRHVRCWAPRLSLFNGVLMSPLIMKQACVRSAAWSKRLEHSSHLITVHITAKRENTLGSLHRHTSHMYCMKTGS